MSRVIQLFSLALLVSLSAIYTAAGQSLPYKQLVGRWVAYYPAPYEFSTLEPDGTVRHHNDDVIPDSVTLEFKSGNHGSIRWPGSNKVQVFTFRLVNSKLIEIQYAGQKPWRHSFTISGRKLSFGEYPVPKEPQESIAILYTLTFVKRS